MNNRRSLPFVAIAVALLAQVLQYGCSSPLDVNTARRETTVNLDSLILSPSFLDGTGDSLFARINNDRVIFATEVQRPFHNRLFDSAYYITIQASRYGLSGRDYEILSLRMDAVRDTGTYTINAPYSAPKEFHPEAAAEYAAQYERRAGAFPETFRTGDPRSSGEIRVVRIDRPRNVMVGTFKFNGYNAEGDNSQLVDEGAFRLRLPDQ